VGAALLRLGDERLGLGRFGVLGCAIRPELGLPGGLFRRRRGDRSGAARPRCDVECAAAGGVGSGVPGLGARPVLFFLSSSVAPRLPCAI